VNSDKCQLSEITANKSKCSTDETDKFTKRITIGSDRRPETKEFKEKLLGSDREGLGIELGLGIRIRIADLNQIANLKLSILAPVKFL